MFENVKNRVHIVSKHEKSSTYCLKTSEIVYIYLPLPSLDGRDGIVAPSSAEPTPTPTSQKSVRTGSQPNSTPARSPPRTECSFCHRALRLGNQRTETTSNNSSRKNQRPSGAQTERVRKSPSPEQRTPLPTPNFQARALSHQVPLLARGGSACSCCPLRNE